jgi:hypothetical protein
MARKQIEIQLEDRDKTLNFVIKEMPATQLESWITRAVLLLAGSGLSGMPGGMNIQKAGEYLSEKGLGVLSTLSYEKAAPLLDELLACCYRKVGDHLERCTPGSVDGYIEDVATLFKLRAEAIKLNLGFLLAETGPLSGFRSMGATTPQ